MKQLLAVLDSIVLFARRLAGRPYFAQYEDRLPAPQNAIDAVSGWGTQFPAAFNVVAGPYPLFEDARIAWAIEQFGDLTDRKVLELGPLDGGHTYMLEAAGAYVEAVEANKHAFLRCLVSKEVAGLKRARFLLGDFIKWLEHGDQTYDLIVACGVLYHMRDPLRVLRALAKKADSLYLWTVSITDENLPVSETRLVNGVPARLYLQTYAHVQNSRGFCGGMEETHYWMHKNDILAVLKSLGFSSLQLAHEEEDHVYGPCFSVFATRIAR